MSHALAPVVLAPDRHYESLRARVWLRAVADDPRLSWPAFEDAYQDVWAWVVARRRHGEDVLVTSGGPVAYLAQAVRRRCVDDARARRRGMGRNAAAPVVESLDEHAERIAAPHEDGDDAREARRTVSAAYLLARERLTARELQAFALSYLLEMKPAEAAVAMGVSAKRFRNLRWSGWRKVGDDVVRLLEGRLDWCDSEEAHALRQRAIAGDPDAAGPLRVHLATCATCSHAVAAARRAIAVVVPLPLVLPRADGSPLDRLAVLVDVFRGLLARPGARIGDVVASVPSGGRAAPVAAAAALAVGGGVAATAIPDSRPIARDTPHVARRTVERVGTVSPPRMAVTTPRPQPAAVATRRPRPETIARPRRRRRPAPSPSPAGELAVRPAPPTAAAPPAAAGTAAAPPLSPPKPPPAPAPSAEFGFE